MFDIMKAARTVALGLIFLSVIFAPVTPSRNTTPLKLPEKMAEQVSAETGHPVILQRPGPLVWVCPPTLSLTENLFRFFYGCTNLQTNLRV
jgi:hypothetical protein